MSQRKDALVRRIKCKPRRWLLLEKPHWTKQLERCCIDRLNRHGLPVTLVPEPACFDGQRSFRAVVYIQNGDCKLISRNLKNLKFEFLRKALATLPVKNAILDGEIICIDAQGVSRFNELFSRKSEPVLYAFDLLWLDGQDMRQRPLIERKQQLRELVRSSCSRIIYAQHIETAGNKFFEEICARDLEGVVAKRKLGIYKDDGNSWLKIKNRSYSQAEGRHELMVRAK